ncbi:MAG: hypothetical protein WBL20_04775 [Sphingobium sp.]
MAARKALAQLVGKLAGRGRRRRAAYPEIREFMEDFQKLPYGNAKRGNEQLTDMLKFVTAGRIDWPIAPFLAWLCYYHRDEAIAFYASVGLTAKFNVRFRQYVGRPGDRAKMARGVLRPTVIPEFIPSGPPNKVSASRGNDQLPNNLTMEVGPFAQGETDLMGESISKEIETKRLDLKNKAQVVNDNSPRENNHNNKLIDLPTWFVAFIWLFAPTIFGYLWMGFYGSFLLILFFIGMRFNIFIHENYHLIWNMFIFISCVIIFRALSEFGIMPKISILRMVRTLLGSIIP